MFRSILVLKGRNQDMLNPSEGLRGRARRDAFCLHKGYKDVKVNVSLQEKRFRDFTLKIRVFFPEKVHGSQEKVGDLS